MKVGTLWTLGSIPVAALSSQPASCLVGKSVSHLMGLKVCCNTCAMFFEIPSATSLVPVALVPGSRMVYRLAAHIDLLC